MIPNIMPTGERDTKMIVMVPQRDGTRKAMKYPVKIRTDEKFHWFLESPFALKDEFKAMQGARWMGYDKVTPIPAWRVNNVRRNNFNVSYLEGLNPFTRYTIDLKAQIGVGYQPRTTRRDWNGQEISIYMHQIEMHHHMMIRKQCIIGGEMGVGKTLSAIESMELSLVPEIWYVAPKSALASVKLENMKWCGRSKIKFMTYEELKKVLSTWVPGTPPPKFVVYDESSRLKTPTSQRSQAAFYLAEAMRDYWGDDCYIVLMSGSPAPKSPLDWYWQCEIACPGFVKEGDIYKFQRRLAVMEERNDIIGHKFNSLVSWKDGNPNNCNICGRERTHPVHTVQMQHEFVPLENEIEKLYKRMSGLVYVKFKKDCLDLPDKVYRTINLKPPIDLLRAARLVTAKCRSAIQALTLMRELSDGFQYKDNIVATDVCEYCHGNRIRYNDKGEPEPCGYCNATGSTNKVEREIIEVASPKIEALTDLLEEMEEQGRLVVYAGFTGSIDRICKHVQKMNWHFIRVDGRGWFNSFDPKLDQLGMLKEFQNGKSQYEKIVFVGHPGSAGMGLTLTASSAICYYSNDFNAESRIQSEDRIHRAGMDTNRGATIIDFILLPTDQKVLDNLKRKRELQSISMGELVQAIDNYQGQS